MSTSNEMELAIHIRYDLTPEPGSALLLSQIVEDFPGDLPEDEEVDWRLVGNLLAKTPMLMYANAVNVLYFRAGVTVSSVEEAVGFLPKRSLPATGFYFQDGEDDLFFRAISERYGKDCAIRDVHYGSRMVKAHEAGRLSGVAVREIVSVGHDYGQEAFEDETQEVQALITSLQITSNGHTPKSGPKQLSK